MPSEPSAEELLRAAHRSMKDRILPALPRELRSEGAMIARVLSIVMAELSGQRETGREIVRIWSALYPDLDFATMAASDLEARIRTDIQDGLFDTAGQRAALENALLEYAALQLACSNPRFVKI